MYKTKKWSIILERKNVYHFIEKRITSMIEVIAELLFYFSDTLEFSCIKKDLI